MEITREVRDYASRLNEAAVEIAEETTQIDPEAASGLALERQEEASGLAPERQEEASGLALEREIESGMNEMSRKFRELGNNVYVERDKT
jgi:phosphomethylpyrimidine synthase